MTKVIGGGQTIFSARGTVENASPLAMHKKA